MYLVLRRLAGAAGVRETTMAEMIYGTAAAFVNQSEKNFFELLKTSPVTKGWTIIYSHKVLDARQGEVDFLAIVPGLGVITIELKSAYLDTKTRGRPGFRYKDGKFSPLDEVFFKLLENERGVRALLHKRFPKVFSGRVVYFQRVSGEALSQLPCPQNLYIDSSCTYCDVPDLVAVKALQQQQELNHKYSFPPFQNLTESQATEIASYLRGELVESESALCERYIAGPKSEVVENLRLSYNMLRGMQRLLVKGPVGSGKTYMLRSRARELSPGKKALVICYNKMLAAQLEKDLKDCPGVDVYYLEAYMLRKSGSRRPESITSEIMRGELAGQAIEKLRRKKPAYDLLLVDEFQDMFSKPWLELLDVSVKGGLAAGKVWLFADFSMAALNSPDVKAAEFLKTYGFQDRMITLNVNRRNAQNVGRALCEISRFPGKKPIYEDFSCKYEFPVDVVTYTTPADHLAKVSAKIAELTSPAYGYKPKDLTLLSAHSDKNSALAGGALCGCAPCVSVHRYKGLESKVVLLCDLYDEPRKMWPDPRVVLYLGFSRAAFRLVCFVHECFAHNLKSLTRVDAN